MNDSATPERPAIRVCIKRLQDLVRGRVLQRACMPNAFVLTQAGTTRRASIHLLADRAALQTADPGGIDVMGCNPAGLRRQAALREPHPQAR